MSIENSINITEDALNKIMDVIKDEENPDLKFGCIFLVEGVQVCNTVLPSKPKLKTTIIF